MTYTLLASDDPRIAALRAAWPLQPDGSTYPSGVARSRWLKSVEDVLRELHPQANSDSLTYTARTLAPFPLAKPGVP